MSKSQPAPNQQPKAAGGATGGDTASTTTLYLLPSTFQLPSVSPECVGAECALRFKRFHFNTVVDPQRSITDWVVPHQKTFPLVKAEGQLDEEADDTNSKKSNKGSGGKASSGQKKVTTTTGYSLTDVLSMLKRSNHNLDGGLSDAQLALIRTTTSFISRDIFPLYWELVLRHSASFAELMKKLPPRSWWSASASSERLGSLSKLHNFYHIQTSESSSQNGKASCVAELPDDELAQYTAEQFLHLEHLLAANGATAKSNVSDVPFFLGSTLPTSVDCYVYAVASCFIHGEFPGAGAGGNKESGGGGSSPTPPIHAVQAAIRQLCPLLCQYTEMIRLLYFAHYSGFYTLRAVPSVKELKDDAEDAVFKKGRWAVIASTAVFASLYFIISNANLIVEVLQALEGDEEGEDDGQNPELHHEFQQQQGHQDHGSGGMQQQGGHHQHHHHHRDQQQQHQHQQQ